MGLLIKLGLLASILGGAGAVLYNAGYNSCDNEHLVEQQRLKDQVKVLEQANYRLDISLRAEREKKQRTITKTVTRVKRELISLPERDCGFTPDERLRVMDAYCANFPAATPCLPGAVPSRTDGTSSGRG